MQHSLLQLDPSLSAQGAQVVFDLVSSSFDKIAQDLLTKPGIYTVLVKYAGVLTAGSITVYLVQWARKMMSQQEALSELIWPLLCAILFSGHATALTQISLGARAVGNEIIQKVLAQEVQGLKLIDGMSRAINQNNIDQFLAFAEEACVSLPEGERQVCLDNYQKQFDQEIAELQQVDSMWSLEYYRKKLQALKDSTIGQLSLGLRQAVLSAIFYLIATVIVWLLEVSTIIALVTAPIALGLSLLPLPGRPILAWISAFIGITVAKIGLIVSNAIAATVVITAGPSLNLMLLPLFMTFGSPFIAFSLGALTGGGVFLSLAASPLTIVPIVGSILRGARR